MIDYVAAGILNLSGLWIAGLRLYRRRYDKTEVVIRPPLWIMGFMVIGVAFDIYMILRAPMPELDWLVASRPALVGWVGIGVMLAGTLLFTAAQFNMGKSWRIGVPDDTNHISELTINGLYRFSRNPIYLGILIMLTGCLLVAPGPISAGIIILSYAGISYIISQEEDYLKGHFGSAYDNYCDKVDRWFSTG